MRARLLVYILLAFVPGLVQALGLGKLELDSALNQPFQARITLLSATVDELDSLNVRLADSEAFERAGIPRTVILQELNFAVKETESGGDYIRVYSTEPIREPFLNFLLEISWSNGRLYREYTVLLDPPVYANEKTQKRLAGAAKAQREKISAPQHAPETDVRELEDNRVVYQPTYTPPKKYTAPTTPVPPTPAPVTQRTYTIGDEYGPVVTGDTLWSLAKNLRPDTSVSIQQMMFAILRANPEAFNDSNINGLRRGHVLKLPDIDEAQSLSKAEAFNLAKNQNELWAEARSAVAAAAPQRSEGKATSEETVEEVETTAAETATGGEATVTQEGQPELRLVTPGQDGEGAGDGTDSETENLNRELILAREELEAISQENAELKGQISETEAIIDDMKRLITLKEEELAMLQQQVAMASAEAEAQAMPESESAEAGPVSEMEHESDESAASTENESVDEGTTEAAGTANEGGFISFIPEFFRNITFPDWLKNIPETLKGILETLKGIPETLKNSSGTLDGIVDTLKNNLPYAGGGIVAFLLLVLLVVRRRRAGAPAKAAAESGAAEEVIEAVDDTDLGQEIEESEAVTALPEGMADDDLELPEPDEGFIDELNDEDTQMAATASLAAEEKEEVEEEDPLADVNVYLAYEDFDQAEEVVRNAIEKEPDNLEYRTKLLEVYYAAGNKKAYEDAARVLHNMVDGKGDYWSMAQAMWQEISPNRELFAEPVAGEEEDEVKSNTGGGIVNIAGDGEATEPAPLDFDLDVTASPQTAEDEDEVLNISSDEEDILDVTSGTSSGTIAGDDEDEEILDLTSISENEDSETESGNEMLDLTFASESNEDKVDDEAETLGSLEANDEVFNVSGDEEESLSLEQGFPEGADETSEVPSALEDGSLDFNIDETGLGGAKSTADTDMSPLERSLDSDESGAESASAINDKTLEFPVGRPPGEPISAETPEEESSFDFSLDNEEGKETGLSEDFSTMELSADNLPGGADASWDSDSAKEEGSIDFETSGEDARDLDLSMDNSDSGLLDISSDLEESKGDGGIEKPGPDLEIEGDILDVSNNTQSKNDLMDVSSTQNFELSDDDDLLDVTSMISSTNSSAEKVSAEEPVDSDSMDLDFSLEEPGEADAGTDELSLDESVPSVDVSDDEGMELMDFDMDNIDSEVLTVSSDDDGEQDIASRLDLAKAYIELGDIDNAKSILDEVITEGNDDQRQEAEELMGQI